MFYPTIAGEMRKPSVKFFFEKIKIRYFATVRARKLWYITIHYSVFDVVTKQQISISNLLNHLFSLICLSLKCRLPKPEFLVIMLHMNIIKKRLSLKGVTGKVR